MTFQDFVDGYRCDAHRNNLIYQRFSEMTTSYGFLIDHRKYIELNKLGFGDRAFHYMWYILLQHLGEANSRIKILEIGVYKGQVISLWSLIAKQLNLECSINCVTPLSGNVLPKNRFRFYWQYFTNKRFRHDLASGNFYDKQNYLNVIGDLFRKFHLDFDKVTIYTGLSTDQNVLSTLRESNFDLIYIDGDHTREVVEMDIKHYAPKINVGGFLVMDDAACNIPGGENGEYWKGHQSVSDACETIPQYGFKNVLNVGHNRVFQKLK